MNKLTKAAIAGAAGIALLLGGAGSLAYWNDSASLAGASINAGTLVIEANGDGAWSDTDGVIADIADFLAVPGDKLTYTAAFNITATGDNLSAKVALDGGSIVPADNENDADNALAALLGKSVVIKVNDVTTFNVAPAVGPQTVEVSVTITWPLGGDGVGNDAMNGKVNLNGMTVTLTQDH